MSFEVKQGEVLGIIGRNGAGKSTLLKILSRITEPTKGRVLLRGRVASLLEVGTGFHPELTGRENIFLNGAILGMTQREIRKKFDEIVAFAEVEKFLDTPVKHYSSGMYVRLAFAVAAHLEPEILIVDEVLAVGDALFQKKCLGKMDDVAKGGRTILFVSHNIGAISTLAANTIFMSNGRIMDFGPTDQTVSRYLASGYAMSRQWHVPALNSEPMQIISATINPNETGRSNEFDLRKDLTIQFEYEVRQHLRGCVVACVVHAADGSLLFSSEDVDVFPEFLNERSPGHCSATVTIPGNWLNQGTYFIRLSCGVAGGQDFSNVEVFQINLIDTGDHRMRSYRRGYFLPNLPWVIQYKD